MTNVEEMEQPGERMLTATRKVLLLTLILYSSLSVCTTNQQFENLRNMSLSDIRVVLRHWFRYYQQLEKQGLTTESDRELVGQVHIMALAIQGYRRGKKESSTQAIRPPSVLLTHIKPQMH